MESGRHDRRDAPHIADQWGRKGQPAVSQAGPTAAAGPPGEGPGLYDGRGLTLLAHAVDILMLEVQCTQPLRLHPGDKKEAAVLQDRAGLIDKARERDDEMRQGKDVRLHLEFFKKYSETMALGKFVAQAGGGLQYIGPVLTVVALALEQAETMGKAEQAWFDVLLEIVLLFELLLPVTASHEADQFFNENKHSTMHVHLLKKASFYVHARAPGLDGLRARTHKLSPAVVAPCRAAALCPIEHGICRPGA
eukprot:196217-Chlamydomonas_euryale.AAC.2